MEILLDTVNFEEIEEMADVKWVKGVTTNPTFFKRQGINNIHEFVDKYFAITQQDLHLELMNEEDEKYFENSSYTIIAKVPFSKQGVELLSYYKSKGIEVNMHLVYSVNQALLAAKAGAKYICVLMGRFDDTGQDAFTVLTKMKQAYNNFDIETKIMAASVRHPLHVEQAALIGLDAITIPYSVINKMYDHPLTERGKKDFEADNCFAKLYE